jgi:uncharacterized protein YjeT (DUF2065 family)
MERSVETVAVILFGVIGLSHMVQPRGWVRFFILLRDQGEPGAFVDGLLNLPIGAVIVACHNVWSGIPVVLTLLGWALVIKGLIRFCAPQLALKMIARVSLDRSSEFQASGAALLALAALLAYRLFTT